MNTPTTPKPTPASGFTNTDALPAYLKEHGLFCLWRYEWDAKRDKGRGGWTKPPYNPNNPQYHAATDKRATFASMEKAAAAGRANGFDGMGIGVFDSVAAIDIDHCIAGGELSEMARDIVQTMDAYTEVSPSGEGIRILFLAPDLRYDDKTYYINNRGKGLEIYLPGMTRKYLTVTGNVLHARDMENRGDRLQTILDKYMKLPTAQAPGSSASRPAAPLTISDAELIDRASNAANGAQFRALWDGQWQGRFPSQSEADQSLCNLLAFWAGGDYDRIDALFRQSGLMRDKWERRERYRTTTIEKAIASCKEFYSPQAARQNAQEAPQQAPRSAEGEREAPAQETPQNAPQTAAGETPAPAANAPQNGAQAAPARSSVELFDLFMQKVQTDAYRPIPTGMPAFDRLLRGGIPKQALVMLSAAPGTGKTSLTQQIFETAATHGTDVIFFNLEMSREQLLARSISRMVHANGGSISAGDVMRGYSWTDAQRRYIEAAAAKYRAEIAPHLQYNPDGSGAYISAIITTLEKAAQAAKAAGKPAPVCVLDYLHLIRAEPGQRADQQEIIKGAVEALKSWAIKYDSYVFAIGANNRAANNRGVISLADGRDTSAIEYTGDIVLALNFRELHEGKADARNPDDMERLQSVPQWRMMVQVLKNRMDGLAKTGAKLYLAFDAANSTFTAETDQTPPPAPRRIQQQDFTPVNDPENPFL